MKIGENIKALRTLHDITQEELAEKVGISQKMLSYIERDDRRPSIEVALRIAEQFNCSLDMIIKK